MDLDDLFRSIWPFTRSVSPQAGGTGTRYVPDADGTGWLVVKLESDKREALPQYLKVRVDNVDRGRDYFTVLEGAHQGKRASVSHLNGRSRLLVNDAHQPPAKVKFDLSAKKLWYGNNGPIEAFTYPSNPVPLGTHAIEIPDAPHGLGLDYARRGVKYATTWFRIGHAGDRYLHPGRISAGCVTVNDLEKWDDLYKYLIKARASGTSVGSIQVVE